VAKTKTSYFCQSCGAQAAKWAGKCNSCGEWNTLVEEVVHKESKNDRLQLFSANKNETIVPINLFYYRKLALPNIHAFKFLGRS
jgi:DNA repair protein RadA/Sms